MVACEKGSSLALRGTTPPDTASATGAAQNGHGGAAGGVSDICAHCGAEYQKLRPWQTYCRKRCNVNASRHRLRSVQRGEAVPPPALIDCAQCGAKFLPRKAFQRYCRTQCRMASYEVSETMREQRRQRDRERRRIRCSYCRGPHMPEACTNRIEVRNEFGTVDPVTREYVPPPGVTVRVLCIPNTVHGDAVGDLLREVQS